MDKFDVLGAFVCVYVLGGVGQSLGPDFDLVPCSNFLSLAWWIFYDLLSTSLGNILNGFFDVLTIFFDLCKVDTRFINFYVIFSTLLILFSIFPRLNLILFNKISIEFIDVNNFDEK